jgi:hypothetical protein
MVLGTAFTTADPPHPVGHVDLRVVYRETANFRVPTTTIQRPKDQGGWAQPDLAVKFRALFLGRMETFAAQKVFATAAFLLTWNLTDSVENHPQVGKIPNKLVHICQYALDIAYVSPPRTN